MGTAIYSFFRAICIIYILEKLLTKQHIKRNQFLFFLSLTALITISFFAQTFTNSLFTIVFIILSSLYIFITYKLKFDFSLVLATISYTIYYIIGNFCSLFVAILVGFIYYQKNSFPYISSLLIINVLTFLLLVMLFKIKRLKSSLSIFTNLYFIRTAILLSITILLLKLLHYVYTYDHYFQDPNTITVPIFLLTFFLALLLYLWWRKQITKSYIEKLRQLEVQSLYDELAEKEKRIQKLTEDNDALARIIHKDNKLIPAMEHAVMDFLTQANHSDLSQLNTHGQQLAEHLSTMSQDRKGILDTYQNKNIYLHQTGYVGIDAILAYMQKKADESNITFECRYNHDSLENLLARISEDDISHLLSDLLENALIAMRDDNSGKLQVTFGTLQKEAYISVADSGQPFDIETLHTFGIYAHTTHKDTGGSGIGLMDIWKLKKKYRASIQIQEYENNKEHFTKKIIFSLNSKNHYVIQSYRHQAISNTQTRGDLYILPTDKNTENGGKSV